MFTIQDINLNIQQVFNSSPRDYPALQQCSLLKKNIEWIFIWTYDCCQNVLNLLFRSIPLELARNYRELQQLQLLKPTANVISKKGMLAECLRLFWRKNLELFPEKPGALTVFVSEKNTKIKFMLKKQSYHKAIVWILPLEISQDLPIASAVFACKKNSKWNSVSNCECLLLMLPDLR